MTSLPGTDSDEAAVLAANQAFYDAFAAKDYTALDAIWARSIEVASVHPLGELVIGRDEVMDVWRQIVENPQQPRVISGGATAVVVGDFAYVTCREFAGGMPIVCTNLFVREDGEWRIAHHHSSPIAILQQ